jgi:hypothetical protein
MVNPLPPPAAAAPSANPLPPPVSPEDQRVSMIEQFRQSQSGVPIVPQRPVLSDQSAHRDELIKQQTRL